MEGNIDNRVYRIYQNCADKMQDTKEDWAKVWKAFESVYLKSGEDQKVNEDIQRCYALLEEQFNKQEEK